MDEEDDIPQDDEVKKPANPLKRAKNTGKTVINSVFSFAKDAVKVTVSAAIPTPVKIVLIIVFIVVILVVVVLVANSEENSNAVTDNVNSYMYSDGVDAEGKKFFDEYASLLAMPLKDINAIYDKFKNDKDALTTIVKNYDYVLGTNEIKEGGDGTSSSSNSSSATSNDVSNMIAKAISMAEKGGIKYCQPHRQTASTLDELDAIERTDCSGFVSSLFKVFLNIDVGGNTGDMISKGKSKHSENGWTAEFHDLKSIDELKPGDMLLRSSHVALYVGDGMLVDNGGPGGSDCAESSDWRGPKHKEVKLSSYNYYVRYTNPNATSSGNGTADPNGNDAEGYQSTFTDGKGRVYKIYKQYVSPWGTYKYRGKNMSKNGCGPTALAIIASGYGKNKTPGEIADYMAANSEATSQDSLSATLSNLLGIKNTKVNSNYEAIIKQNLNSGRPIVISVNSTPDNRFTNNSHIMTLLGIKNDSEVFIGNPGANDTYTNKCGWNSLSGLLPYIGYIITIDSDS